MFERARGAARAAISHLSKTLLSTHIIPISSVLHAGFLFASFRMFLNSSSYTSSDERRSTRPIFAPTVLLNLAAVGRCLWYDRSHCSAAKI